MSREEGGCALCQTHAKLLLVSLYIPAMEEKWCEHVPSVQPSVLPPPDTRVASQESQVISQSPGKCLLLLMASQQESSSSQPS